MLREARAALEAEAEERPAIDEEALQATGSVIVVEGADAVHPLKLESLDRASGWWRLLSVYVDPEDGTERAIVWIADEHRQHFLGLFNDYLDEGRDSNRGTPRNAALVANIGRIRASILRDLWQSDGEPPLGRRWWEIWLRREEEAEDLLRRFCESQRLPIASERLVLDERVVLWVRGRWEDLTILPSTAVPVAEIRRGQFIDTVVDLDSADVEGLVDDLRERLELPDRSAPAVCLLDTGARRSHALLEASLDENDCHSVLAGGSADRHGHGTQMAGLALYGPLDDSLLHTDRVQLRHRLESVRILPYPGQADHDPKTYGLVTAQAVSAPEAATKRRRVLCMPITSQHELSTEPSLWSASVDALAAGTDIGLNSDGIELLGPPDVGAARLFVVSTGNVDVRPPPSSYLDECDTSVLEDPAQAWNALVVGAYTNLDELPTDPSFAGWSLVGERGNLSPHSRTGVGLPPKWPIRPDVCLEGGNVLTDGTDLDARNGVVSLATTSHTNDSAITTANATSAATAEASRLAALVMATYPTYWPETVRGLIVHGAEWTPAMQAQVDAASTVADKRTVLGRYGWGVPRASSVLASSERAVTMVVQDQFVPFTGPAFAMRQFRLHQLPWPSDVLSDLGPEDVQLRVTLSYFVEPSAPRRGWRSRYSYASHGLRFELQNVNEPISEFTRRVNREAGREEGGSRTTGSGVDRWLIGPNTRNDGSLHQDVWVGTGAELAACNLLAVHPVGGWWKYANRRDRRELPVRYALIVSLSTASDDVNIYQSVAAQLEIDIEAVSIEI